MLGKMKKGFYTIIFAQFLSSLADNALLIAAIAILTELLAPSWMSPLLKLFFTVSYVILAPFVGPFSDSFEKGKVMFLTNNIKVLGCILFFFNVHPLLAYAVVGFGAASYAPAKYGILTELLPPDKLVFANGWLESTTVVSILLGTLLGGFLISDFFINLVNDSGLTATLQINSKSEAGLMVIVCIYALAAFFNLLIPKTGAVYSIYSKNPITLTKRFFESNKILWNDKVGQISLAVTTLFWGAGATLQFIVLQWAQEQLNMTLDKAAMLQGIVALGIIAGSILAGQLVNLRSSIKVLPVGVFMGLVVPLMTLASNIGTASILLIIIGTLAGFFVVPMNALLQHRGYVTLSAGQSIAVQNFNENSNVLVMLSVYSFLLFFDMSANTVVTLFGSFVAVTMALVIAKYRRNKSTIELDSLIGDKRSSVYQK
jgi:MFS family permease